ncbi:hypothetical protein [Rhodoblastus sp.]|uniref:hypothetical protein n=1 Tax=Rhodoblastus sp. TaxID=1962975 RepID=UPI00260FF6B5|nr:hypothetical protein [Rhodoblastus sp.]
MSRVLERIPGASYLLRRAFRRQLRRKFGEKPTLDGAAVVVLMPGSLHIGLLALQHISQYETIIAVANGMTEREIEFIERNTNVGVIRLPATLRHSTVIDILVAELKHPFWIVDHDCYILDTNILHSERRKMPASAVGVAIYSEQRRADSVVVPETFLMLLNPEVIRGIYRKYDVRAARLKWRDLNLRARNALKKIGIDEARLPERHKDYLDTLRAVAFLAQADGQGFVMNHGYSLMCRFYPEAIHIGNTSFPNWPPVSRYNALGAYFWRRCLEEPRYAVFVDQYNSLCPTLPRTSLEIRNYLLEVAMAGEDDAAAFLDRLDGLITKYSS